MIDRIQKWLPTLTLHTFFIVLPLLFTVSSDELFEFPKVLLAYVTAILLIASWLVQAVHTKKLHIPKTILSYPIFAFVGSQIISTVFSINTHTSLYGYYSRFNGGLFTLFSYTIILYGCLLWVTNKNIFSYFRSLVLGGALAALYAFPEHFGHSPSCYLITGQFTADCWVQDVQTRIFGTLGQPNWLAAVCVVLLPLTLAFILINQEKILQSTKLSLRTYGLFATWILTFLLFSFVLVYTKSRSGLLGAGLALLMQFFFTILLSVRSRATQKKYSQHILPFVLLTTFCLLLFCIPNPVRDKLEQLVHLPLLTQTTSPKSQAPTVGTQLDSGGSESGDIRKVVWSGALKVWLRYPLFGSGVETFAYSYYKDRPQAHNLLSEWDFLYNKAHNEFLNYLATTGAVGLITYVLMYGSFIVFPLIWAFKKENQESGIKNHDSIVLLLASSSALAGLAVSNFFGFSTVVVSMYTFVLPALAVILSGNLHVRSVDLHKVFEKKIVSNVVIGAIFLASCFMLLSIYRMYAIDVDYATSKTMIDHQDVENGVALLQSVVDASPYEPVYRDEFAYTAARLSYALGTTGDSTSAAKLAQAAIDQSDEVLTQNHANVNFYKTRARIFTLLGQMSPVFYEQAMNTLSQARDLSPTDPKLTSNQALIAKARGDMMTYEKALRETLALRPIDIQARLDLAKLYESEKKVDDAKSQYAQVLQLDPTNKDAKDRIASLSSTQKKKL